MVKIDKDNNIIGETGAVLGRVVKPGHEWFAELSDKWMLSHRVIADILGELLRLNRGGK